MCFQDQRSTILSVDNFNGIKLCRRPIQVDHCDYRTPKFKENIPKEILKVWEEGCAPKPIIISESKFLLFYCLIFNYLFTEEAKAEAKSKKKEKKDKLKKLETTIILENTEISKDIRKAQKRARKEKKKMKKIEKHIKRMKERLPTPDGERGTADDDGRWDDRKRKLDFNELDVCFLIKIL